jgi:hypothetical protein
MTPNANKAIEDVYYNLSSAGAYAPPDKRKRIIDYCSLDKYRISITACSSGQVVTITLEISHGRGRNFSILYKITFKQQYIQS